MPALLNLAFAASLMSSPAAPVEEPVASNSPAGGFALPQVVEGRNAFVVRTPVALPLVDFAPRVHLELGWMHALRGPHWIGVSGIARLDHFPTSKVVGSSCVDSCDRVGAYGGELAVDYRFVPRFHRKPWLAPVVHGGLVGGTWFFGESPELPQHGAVSLGARVGAGLRIFLTPRIGVGAEVDASFDLRLALGAESLAPRFGLGLALLPAVLEIRG